MKRTRFFPMISVWIGALLMLLIAQARLTDQAYAQGKATPIPTIMSDTTVSVSLSNPTVAPGEEFDIAVNVSTDTPTWSSQLILTYDPALVEILSVSEGAFYGDWAKANGVSTFVLPNEPDNAAGQVIYAVTLLGAPAGQGPTGAGTLVTYQARAKPEASGNIEFGLEEVIVSDTAINDAQKVQTQKLGGIKVQNGVMTIGGQEAAEPIQPTPEALLEPTALPTATPEPTVVRRADTAEGDQQGTATSGVNSSGIPWIIVAPLLGVVVIGGLVFVLSKRK